LFRAIVDELSVRLIAPLLAILETEAPLVQHQ